MSAGEMLQGTTARKPRILLVEEQPTDRAVVRRALEALKGRVERVATGHDALAWARRGRAHLILLSATLPDLSGPALVSALRQLPGLDQVPIVAICPADRAELRQACLAAGAAAHLVRPLKADRLRSLLAQLMDRRGAVPVPEPEPVLDLEHLRTFTEGDLQLEDELSTLFLSTVEMYLHDMQEALTGGRPWTSVAHALKGASGNLGARRLSALALLAERSEPNHAQLEAIQQAVQEVRALFAGRVHG